MRQNIFATTQNPAFERWNIKTPVSRWDKADFVCFAVGAGRYAGRKAPGKNGKECVSQEKPFPCTGQIPQKPMAENKACPKLQGSQFCRRPPRRGGKGKSGTARGISHHVENINKRLPVTGQCKMEFLLRICLCHVSGVTRVWRLV